MTQNKKSFLVYLGLMGTLMTTAVGAYGQYGPPGPPASGGGVHAVQGPFTGNPVERMPLAVAAVSNWFEIGGLLAIFSIPRSKVTNEGSGHCSPLAWKYVFAPTQAGRDKNPSVAATFEIDDHNYPTDTDVVPLDSPQLKNMFPMDLAEKKATGMGLTSFDRIGISDFSGGGLRYEFTGKDSGGQILMVFVQAKDGSATKFP